MFWIIKVKPLYECSRFMLNLEQVPFNIIEKRMQNPRNLDGREHLCHCYACCLVTTVFTVQQTETMHEESLPLWKKKKWLERTPYFMEGFEGGIFLGGSIIFVWILAQTDVDNEINFTLSDDSLIKWLIEQTHSFWWCIYCTKTKQVDTHIGYNATVMLSLVSNSQTWPVMPQ